MTEIVLALGLGDHVVGVTTYCDYPEEAKKKPKVGGMSNPSLETVVSLKPDLVVLTTDGNPKEFQERLKDLKIKTYVFTARRLSELPQGHPGTRQGAGRSRTGQNNWHMRQRPVWQKFKRSFSSDHAPSSKVLFIVWPEPLIVAGPRTVIDDAFPILGQKNIAASAKTEYPKYSIEEVIRQAARRPVHRKINGHGHAGSIAGLPRTDEIRSCRAERPGVLPERHAVPARAAGGKGHRGDGKGPGAGEVMNKKIVILVLVVLAIVAAFGACSARA